MAQDQCQQTRRYNWGTSSSHEIVNQKVVLPSVGNLLDLVKSHDRRDLIFEKSILVRALLRTMSRRLRRQGDDVIPRRRLLLNGEMDLQGERRRVVLVPQNEVADKQKSKTRFCRGPGARNRQNGTSWHVGKKRAKTDSTA